MADLAAALEIGWKLLLVAFFVAANGFFVAAEFAIVRVRDTQLRAIGAGTRVAAARHVVGHLDAYLSACQLGITLASLALGWIGEPFVTDLLVAPLLGRWIADPGTLRFLSVALGFAAISALHIVLGEMAPKYVAIQRPQGTALGVSLPLRAFHKVFAPFIWTLNESAKGLLRLFGFTERTGGETDFTLEELRLLLAQVPSQEGSQRRSAEVAGRVLELNDLCASDIMVPRGRMVVLDIQRPFSANLRMMKENAFTRFPLCDGGADAVLGFVHERDLYNALDHDEEPDLLSLRREVLAVAATERVSRTLFAMLEKHRQLAIVVDEKGTTVGLLTLEDIFEELVGEIKGEFERPERFFEVLGSGDYLVDASIPIPDLQVLLAEPLERGAAPNLAALLNELFGRTPAAGDRLRVGRYEYVVRQADRNRARSVEIRLVEPPPA